MIMFQNSLVLERVCLSQNKEEMSISPISSPKAKKVTIMEFMNYKIDDTEAAI